MTQHSFTRQQLYDLVWGEPMRTLAKRYGLSDVGFAKACRRADIPVPERGYWAKLQAGKAVAKPPLPEHADKPQTVVVSPPRPKPSPGPAAQAVLERETRPAITVPDSLRNPHPLVRAWMDENDRRRREAKRSRWSLAPEDLTTPLQRRRLRLYHALFTALQTRGFTLQAERGPDGWAEATKQDETITFRLYGRQRQVRRPITAEERSWSWNAGKTDLPELVATEDLVLKINTYTRGAMAEDYRDKKTTLEEQLGQIVVAFEAGIAELTAWRIEQAEERERRRAEQLRRERRAQRQTEEAAQRARLVETAARWRQAQDLRAYIAAVAASPAAADPRFAAWRAWASETLETLDPLLGEGPDLEGLPPIED